MEEQHEHTTGGLLTAMACSRCWYFSASSIYDLKQVREKGSQREQRDRESRETGSQRDRGLVCRFRLMFILAVILVRK